MDVKKRIKMFVESLNISMREFEKSIGVSNGYVNSISRSIGIDKINKIIEKYPKLNIEWLLSGQGSMLKDDIQEPNVQATQVFRRRTDRLIDAQDIPLYDIRSLAGLSPIFNGQKTVPIDTLRIPNLPKVDGAVFVTGDSMYPVLKSGDIIVLKKINDIPDGILWGEIYLLDIDLSGDDMVTVKYVQRSEKGDEWLKLVSQNEHHQPKDIHLKKVRAMAHVKASVRFHTML